MAAISRSESGHSTIRTAPPADYQISERADFRGLTLLIIFRGQSVTLYLMQAKDSDARNSIYSEVLPILRPWKASAMRPLAVFTAIGIAAALLGGCGSQSHQPSTLEVEFDDPLASTFENCADLFKPESNSNECEFSSRRERGYDVVEEKISCKQQSTDVACELRPGPGPGPDLNWMNYACNRASRKCRITAGNLGFTSAYTRLFEEHNAGLKSAQAIVPPESR